MKQKSRKIKVDIVKRNFDKFPLNEEYKGLKIENIRCLTPKERDDNFRCNNIPIMIELENGAKIQAFSGAFTLPLNVEFNHIHEKYEKIYKKSPEERGWEYSKETRNLKIEDD